MSWKLSAYSFQEMGLLTAKVLQCLVEKTPAVCLLVLKEEIELTSFTVIVSILGRVCIRLTSNWSIVGPRRLVIVWRTKWR